MFIKRIKIRKHEAGLYFRDGEFKGLLREGRHWFVDPLGKVKIEVVSQRAPWLQHEKLDVISRSGALKGRAVVLDLKDYERALVWIEGRFSHILPPGLYAYWTALRDVKVKYKQTYLGVAEVFDIPPAQVMMVAAHKDDLAAARDCGLATAFVERPREFGDTPRTDLGRDPSIDVHARDFLDLADQLVGATSSASPS